MISAQLPLLTVEHDSPSSIPSIHPIRFWPRELCGARTFGGMAVDTHSCKGLKARAAATDDTLMFDLYAEHVRAKTSGHNVQNHRRPHGNGQPQHR